MAEIRLEQVRKVFGDLVAVGDVSLTIPDREFMVLLGPSGCGKSTLLRSIAGLEQVDGGRIFIGDRDVTNLPPRRRGISMVFQSYAVFPHMTVFDNIGFGLTMQRRPEEEIRKRVQAAAELLHIEDLLKRYPAQLSGGQRQRVAVARAIAIESQVLLMDEPLSNLDALLRLEMRAELKRLLNELNTTVIYVTHDQVEALSMGDRIAVMRHGKILQCDPPIAVYNNPAAHFIGSFIGNPPMNFLTARPAGDKAAVLVSNTAFPLDTQTAGRLQGMNGAGLWLGIRAENIEAMTGPAEGALPARVLVVEPLGSHNLLTVQVGDEQLKVNAHADTTFEAGQEIWLRLSREKIRWLDKNTGLALV
ncbi:MAG: ABC transporter ATP-binding protein [Chloroflexi bacterium]|nr:ABC transporter ATP-binding protein [Chloroflexota bacterium]MCI0580450.1 ABC transporter ATP-binding protein [Chloroflexota bacterium]MCI0649194.1 ABC transporter ATP-binding protein [Chloroflexota bacterium]MCI0727994.1 ABC transporter ATP-binding protein [Chloroflexota bacterium]